MSYGGNWCFRLVTRLNLCNEINKQILFQNKKKCIANNMSILLDLLCKEKEGGPRAFNIDLNDQIVRGMTCVHRGEIIWPPPDQLNAANAKKKEAEVQIEEEEKEPSIFSNQVLDLTTVGELVTILCAAVFFAIVAAFAPVLFIQQLLYFIVAGCWNIHLYICCFTQ
jgi:NAD(P) transhydrogenase subunit alpha